MWPDRVSNTRPLAHESDALPTALRGPASPTKGKQGVGPSTDLASSNEESENILAFNS